MNIKLKDDDKDVKQLLLELWKLKAHHEARDSWKSMLFHFLFNSLRKILIIKHSLGDFICLKFSVHECHTGSTAVHILETVMWLEISNFRILSSLKANFREYQTGTTAVCNFNMLVTLLTGTYLPSVVKS